MGRGMGEAGRFFCEARIKCLAPTRRAARRPRTSSFISAPPSLVPLRKVYTRCVCVEGERGGKVGGKGAQSNGGTDKAARGPNARRAPCLHNKSRALIAYLDRRAAGALDVGRAHGGGGVSWHRRRKKLGRKSECVCVALAPAGGRVRQQHKCQRQFVDVINGSHMRGRRVAYGANRRRCAAPGWPWQWAASDGATGGSPHWRQRSITNK